MKPNKLPSLAALCQVLVSNDWFACLGRSIWLWIHTYSLYTTIFLWFSYGFPISYGLPMKMAIYSEFSHKKLPFIVIFHSYVKVYQGVNQWPFQEPIDWRYLPYIRPSFQAYVREYPHKILPKIWYSTSNLGS